RAGSFEEGASRRRGCAISGDENSPAAPAAPSAAAPRIKRRLQSSHMRTLPEGSARDRSLSLAADTALGGFARGYPVSDASGRRARQGLGFGPCAADAARRTR